MNKESKILSLSIIVSSLIISGTIICLFLLNQSNNYKSTTVMSVKEGVDIHFEVSKFEINYNENISDKDYLYSETYDGTGFVLASGNSEMVKKPYYVALQITKVKGGEANPNSSDNTIIRMVMITNGSGTFTTVDSNWHKDKKMTKPEYKFKIIGFIPITEQNN